MAFRLTVWVFCGWLSLAAPASAGAAEALPSSPASYQRQILFQVRDVEGRPVPEVQARLSPSLGRVLGETIQYSDAAGRISVLVKPVVEDPLAGLRVRDRFLFFHTALQYRLSKPGYLDQEGRIKDRQEWAAFADPLYQGLNRRPSPKPLVIPVTLTAYADYLARPLDEGWGPTEKEKLHGLIEALLEAGPGQDFSLKPGSLDCQAEGLFRLGLTFKLLFDPAEVGAREAGAVLFRGPFLTALKVLHSVFPAAAGLKTYELRVQARFESRKEPFPEPVPLTYLFRLPASAAPLFLEGKGEGPYPLDLIEVRAGEQVLDLSRELKPGPAQDEKREPSSDEEKEEDSP